MMKVNIAGLSSASGEAVSFSFRVSSEKFAASAEEALFTGDISVRGKATNTGASFRVEGRIEAVREFLCDRCLAPCREEQAHDFAEKYYRAGDAPTDEEANVFDGDVIDIAELVRDTLLAAQPLKLLCRPDCKGLCPVCGADRNDGECGCDRFVPDPRLAALRDFSVEQE